MEKGPEKISSSEDRSEKMIELFWKGTNLKDILSKDVTEADLKEFARKIMEDENKQYGINLIVELAEHYKDKSGTM